MKIKLFKRLDFIIAILLIKHSYKISRLYVRHCGLMKPFVLDQFDAPELDSDTESQLNQSTKELGIHPIIGLESMEIISFIGRIWHFKNHDWRNP